MIINLDTRYFRDTVVKVYYKPLGKEKKEYKYEPNATGDVLGEAQWQWLETELRNSDAAFFIVNSSIQVCRKEHRFEKWANFPTARQRLLGPADKTKKEMSSLSVATVILLSFQKLIYRAWITLFMILPPADSPIPGPRRGMKLINSGSATLIIQKNFGLIMVHWSKKELKVTLPNSWQRE